MLETSCLDEAQENKQREESGVLVPTSGEHYFDWSGENCWQGAVWHTAPLKLAMQLLLLADPSSLHQGRTHGPVTDTQSVVEVQSLFARTPCVGRGKPELRTRCTDAVQWGAWTPLQLVFGLWSERSVFFLDELETDLLPASLSKCSSGNQTGLIHQDCWWGSIFAFHLRLVFNTREAVDT